jgi:hypothetical protein
MGDAASPRWLSPALARAGATRGREGVEPTGQAVEPAAVLRLGRAHAGYRRGALQPHRPPRRHGLAVRQLVHRVGPAPVRLQGRGGAHRRGILDAAFFDGRRPEAFGGYERAATKDPVQYPTACSPQAWSTGAPLLLLRTMQDALLLRAELLGEAAAPCGQRRDATRRAARREPRDSGWASASPTSGEASGTRPRHTVEPVSSWG